MKDRPLLVEVAGAKGVFADELCRLSALDTPGVLRAIDLRFEAEEGLDPEVIVSGRPAPERLDAPSLTHLLIPFAGLPVKTREALLDRPNIAVHNIHHNAASTAETAFGLLLAAAKKLLPADRALRRHDWTPRYTDFGMKPLAGRTLLIVGLGAVGRRVARAAEAFDLKVVGVRRSGAPVPELPDVDVRETEALDELLPSAEFIVLSCPATPETEGLFDRERFARVSPGCVVVNVARAAVLDEAALFDALRDGPVGAAGLDVWYAYPEDETGRLSTPPSRFPFEELDNVVMSPHRAGHADDREELRARHVWRFLDALRRNAELPNRVDVVAGY